MCFEEGKNIKSLQTMHDKRWATDGDEKQHAIGHFDLDFQLR